MTVQEADPSRNVVSRTCTTLYTLDPSGRQVPIYRYWPISVRALADPSMTTAAKLALAVLHGMSERRHGKVDGPSVAELAAATGITPRTWRRHRDQLAERGLVEVDRLHGGVRHPDVYRLDLEHQLLAGDVIHVPRALTHLPAQVVLLVAYLAWRNGTYGPRPIASSEIAAALGLQMRAAKGAIAAAIDLGLVERISNVGKATAYALATSWAAAPAARRGDLRPVQQTSAPVQFATALVQDPSPTRAENRGPYDPQENPSGIPLGSPRTHGRRSAAPKGEDLQVSYPRSARDWWTEALVADGKLTPEDLAALTAMEDAWRVVADLADPTEDHGWSAIDRSIVSRRLLEVGRDDVAARLARFCDSWPVRRSTGWIRTRQPDLAPPIALLKNATIWASLATDAAQNKHLRAMNWRPSKQDLLRIGEYDEAEAADAPKSGW